MNFSDLVPYEIICKAANFDSDALMHVVKHFEPLINEMSFRSYIDDDGNERQYLDEDIKQELIIELIVKQQKFRCKD